MAKTWTETEKAVLKAQAALKTPFGELSEQGQHAAAIAALAVKLGMPADKEAAFLAAIAPFGFAGNASQWAQTYAKAFGEVRAVKSAGADVDAALAALKG